MDYRGIEALHMVQSLQSFDLAAKKLFITQSAVSQRIKGLEDHYKEPVLTRQLPYMLTKLGTKLILHYKKVCLLKEEFEQQLGLMNSTLQYSIAINHDSLETWFLDLIEDEAFSPIIFEILVDDQERTLEYLKNGAVSACLSTSKKEILGGKVYPIGEMEYVLSASPPFAKQYFVDKNRAKCLCQAPAIKFEKNDKLEDLFLKKFFGITKEPSHFHAVPSVKGLKKFAVLGKGYALLPKIDIQHELRAEQLVEVYPDKVLKIPLYWHHLDVDSKSFQQFNRDIVHCAKIKLAEV